ncbi:MULTISPECIES: helix-turn-helix transcriptional regulator [unclassified Clostridium]|uniref:helix-turn-helix transcriptional regulator n=1 Tax=unclassified Clostridium TaxID=2614128 RepID=UPI00207AE29F|nr:MULTISPECIES: helix-turn-helix transcriptional regulator [unclassified Clostridium]
MCKNNVLKSLRAAQDITQKKMAEVINVSVPTYNRKELGVRPFTLQESLQIANFFGKTIEEIFFNSKVNTNKTKVI